MSDQVDFWSRIAMGILQADPPVIPAKHNCLMDAYGIDLRLKMGV
jgi:hypothetical protein